MKENPFSAYQKKSKPDLKTEDVLDKLLEQPPIQHRVPSPPIHNHDNSSSSEPRHRKSKSKKHKQKKEYKKNSVSSSDLPDYQVKPSAPTVAILYNPDEGVDQRPAPAINKART
jgi:hypothetical protein